MSMKPETRKRILIITYYWPPSGGAGVQRWLKFTKYLPQFGWDPIVFTPESPEFDLKDKSLIKDVNPEIEVLKFPIWEPYRIFKKISGNKQLKQGQILESQTGLLKNISIWLRGNIFVPDPKVFWVKPSAEYILSILESNEIKHIVTTGPPHSVHLIGKRLKLKNPALTWIADFRDPWSEWDILKKMRITPFVWKKHLKLEESVIKMADSVLATGPTAAEEFKKLGARRINYITNGFDSEDTPTELVEKAQSKFTISHLGMLNGDRNPTSLWNALEELCSETDFYDALELRLTGILSPEVVKTIEMLPKLNSKLKLNKSIPHEEVFKEYRASDLLILVQTEAEGGFSQLPGKLFEYTSSKRPIIAIGRQESDIAQILEETNSGQSFNYSDRNEIKSFLSQEFSAWQEKKSNWKFINVEKFERKNLTKELAEWLDSL